MGKLIINSETSVIKDHILWAGRSGSLDGPVYYHRNSEPSESDIEIIYPKNLEPKTDWDTLKLLDNLMNKLNETLKNKIKLQGGCSDPEHDSPTHSTKPVPGEYDHICPSCKKETRYKLEYR